MGSSGSDGSEASGLSGCDGDGFGGGEFGSDYSYDTEGEDQLMIIFDL